MHMALRIIASLILAYAVLAVLLVSARKAVDLVGDRRQRRAMCTCPCQCPARY